MGYIARPWPRERLLSMVDVAHQPAGLCPGAKFAVFLFVTDKGTVLLDQASRGPLTMVYHPDRVNAKGIAEILVRTCPSKGPKSRCCHSSITAKHKHYSLLKQHNFSIYVDEN